MHAIFSFDTTRRRPGIAAGVAVSLLLHAVLLFGYRLSRPPQAGVPPRAMTVWLQPARPPQPVPAIVEPPRLRERTPPRARTAVAGAPATPRPPAEAQPARTAPPAASQAITVPREQDPLYVDQQPKQFNMDEALKAARAVAREKAPPGTLSAQLDSHPLYPEDHETKLQKGVAGAKKYDCLQAGAGAGLLAPLVWALDKHCKF